MDTLLGDQVDGDEVLLCLLLPIASSELLLLPRVTVAEIEPYRPPQSKLEQKIPEWFLGDLLWRGLTIPTLSFEKITGQEKPPVNRNSQIAVLNNTGVSKQLPFLAISTTDIPRLSRVTREGVHATDNSNPRNYEIMHVIIGDRQAIIPDVSALEQACVDLLGF